MRSTNHSGVRGIFAGLLVDGALLGAEAPVGPQEGIALAIVFDTSGSMKDAVPNRDGRPTPKYVIANRALQAVADQLETFVKGAAPGATRRLQTGLIVFKDGHPRDAIAFSENAPDRLRRWAADFRQPAGSTPLGESLRLASQRVLASPLSRKHVLVVTDGINTAGPAPEQVLPGLRRTAEQKQTVLGVHFIAFDVNARVFDPVKRLGATVVGAMNEGQLRSQLQTILAQKILLEDEEPPAPGTGKQGKSAPPK